MENEKLVEWFDYRGFHLPIYFDDPGQCLYTKFDGEDLCFGAFNSDYEDDLKYLIDDKLDTITRFGEDRKYWGARLEWFQNGYDDRDIRLVYRTRALKIFLVADPDKVNIPALADESKQILDKIIKE